MRTQIVDCQSFSGPTKMQLPATGELVEFTNDVDHGDWKTASVHKDRWPTIPKGTKCRMVGWMQNMYGVHVRVEHAGQLYDVDSAKVRGLR